MTRAEFSFPTRILFGAGTIAELRERLNRLVSSRPLIVTDAGLVATNTFRKAIAAAPDGHCVFSKVQSNPVEEDVEGATRAFIENGCDAVVGIGGGSAIDVAKILRLRVKRPDWRLHDAPPDPSADVG